MGHARERKFDTLELERLLVCGEEIVNEQGQTTIQYPSCRILAQRFGVSHTTVSKFAKDYDCLNRRDLNRAKLQARIEQKLTERHADAITNARTGTLSIIDAFLNGFSEALNNKQVRMENVSDFNMMVRLREFLTGGVDQRAELQGQVSLETLQARYQRWLQGFTTPNAESTTASTSGNLMDSADRLTEEDDVKPRPILMQATDETFMHQNPTEQEEHPIDHPIDQRQVGRTTSAQTPPTVRLARSNNK